MACRFGVGSAIPLIVLTLLFVSGAGGRTLVVSVFASAWLVLLSVLMMRYNVVIGGQEIAKTGHGLIAYVPPLLGREGLLASGVVLFLPFVLLSIVVRFFPPWRTAQSH